MAIILTLTVPITKPDITTYRVRRLDKNLDEKLVHIELRGGNNEYKEHNYVGDVATTFIKFLNKSNNSIKSEEQRILEQLVTDGVISGVISGSPD